MKKSQTHHMAYIAILSGLSAVLMFLDFPIPFFPPFLKFDVSDAVVLASSIFVGPIGMLAIIVIRSLLHWVLKGAELGVPVGQVVSIISSISFCLVAYFVNQKAKIVKNEKYRLALGLCVGSFVMMTTMFVINYFWVTPFYFALGNMPLPTNYFQYMLLYIPFNLLKGLLNSLVVFLLYPHLRKIKLT